MATTFEEAQDDVLRKAFDNAQSTVRPVVHNVYGRVLLDLHRKNSSEKR